MTDGDVYRHTKTGGLYRVVARAAMEASGTIVIVYQHAAGGTVWVRPLREFVERFTLVTSTPAEGR